MAVQKGLGGLRRIRLHEAAVAVGQVQHEVVHLALHTGDDRHRLAEITLGVARRVGQRHEHLLRPPPTLPDVILDYGVLTVEPVLVLEALKDSLGRVALLPGNSAIAFQDRVNHAGEGLQLGSPWRTLAPIARRHRVGQHLAHRVPVQAEHPGGFPNAHAFHHAGPPHLNVHLHWKTTLVAYRGSFCEVYLLSDRFCGEEGVRQAAIVINQIAANLKRYPTTELGEQSSTLRKI